MLDKHVKAFIVYITFLSLSLILIYLAKEIQIDLLITKTVII